MKNNTSCPNGRAYLIAKIVNMMDEYIDSLIDILNRVVITTETNSASLEYGDGVDHLIDLFSECKRKGNKVYFIGNGGSAAIASHMTADYMKNGGMNTCSLYDNAVMTCMGNDYGYEYIFSKPLNFLMKENDLLIAISSSGHSKNILNATDVAKEKKAELITFTGFKPDNPLRQRGTINIYVPSEKYGIVESIHNLILQEIVDIITERDGVEI